MCEYRVLLQVSPEIIPTAAQKFRPYIDAVFAAVFAVILKSFCTTSHPVAQMANCAKLHTHKHATSLIIGTSSSGNRSGTPGRICWLDCGDFGHVKAKRILVYTPVCGT